MKMTNGNLPPNEHLIRHPDGPVYLKYKSCDLDLEFLAHPTIESYDREAGFADAALSDALRWNVPRSTSPEFDRRIVPEIEKLTGMKRRVDKKATEAARSRSKNPDRVSPIMEKLVIYIAWVMASVTPEVQTQIRELALKVSRTIRIDVAPAERQSQVEPFIYRRAETVLSLDLDTINKKVLKWQNKIPNFELARDPDGKPILQSLARMLQQYDAAIYAEED